MNVFSINKLNYILGSKTSAGAEMFHKLSRLLRVESNQSEEIGGERNTTSPAINESISKDGTIILEA